MSSEDRVSKKVQRQTRDGSIMYTDKLVGVKVAAEVVGMGAGSLYRLCKSGAVRSFKAGPKLSGVRLSIPELLADLRRPIRGEGACNDC